MKKLPVLLIVFAVNLCFSQITVINTGTSGSLRKISHIGSNFLINSSGTFLGKCYGECDTIIHLNIPPFPSSDYGFDVSRPDTNVLFITASSYLSGLNLMLWKSTDGGYNWVKKFDTTSPSIFIGVTVFFDTLNGICFSNNKLIKTIDGLNTYSLFPLSLYNPNVVVGFGDSTFAISSCGGSCGITTSLDRANTWKGSYGTGQHLPSAIKFLNKDTLFAIAPVSSQTAYLFRSFNSGVSWDYKSFYGEPFNSPPPENLTGLCVKSRGEIYILGVKYIHNSGYNGNAVILKSNDLGQTWSKFITPFTEYLYDMEFINDSIALVCGSNGLLFKWNSKTAIFTGLSENSKNDLQLNVYPNPVHDKLTLEFDHTVTEIKATFTNVFGQTISKVFLTTDKKQIDLSEFPKGIYFLRVENRGKFKVAKIIKY